MKIIRGLVSNLGCVWTTADWTDDVLLDVLPEDTIENTCLELAVEDRAAALEDAGGCQLTRDELHDLFAWTVENGHYVLEVLPDATIALKHDLYLRDLETFARSLEGISWYLRSCPFEQFVIVVHKPGSVIFAIESSVLTDSVGRHIDTDFDLTNLLVL